MSTVVDPPFRDLEAAIGLASEVLTSVQRSVRGKPDAVRLAVATLLSGGHLLLQDLPGTGKTLLAKALAQAMGGRFGRVQCTPDLLPTDLTGTSVYQPATGEWAFRPGPIFANVVLVDEVNRASPRTQSALLEPMEERQVTVDGATRALPDPFLCIATQNPFGQLGTFPLPESQLDRFALVLSLGTLERAAERAVLLGDGGVAILADLGPVTTPEAVSVASGAIRRLAVAESLVEYVLDLADRTRSEPRLRVGASTRAVHGVLDLARAHAVVSGRDHVTPDDVQFVFRSALAHRVVASEPGDVAGAWHILGEILATTAVPR